MGWEVALGTAGLAALVWKFVDFLRLLSHFATEKSAVITQLTAWGGGIVAVELFAHSDFGKNVTIGTTTLDKYSGMTLLIIGLMASSIASAAVDYKQARDTTDSAAKPPLLK